MAADLLGVLLGRARDRDADGRTLLLSSLPWPGDEAREADGVLNRESPSLHKYLGFLSRWYWNLPLGRSIEEDDDWRPGGRPRFLLPDGPSPAAAADLRLLILWFTGGERCIGWFDL